MPFKKQILEFNPGASAWSAAWFCGYLRWQLAQGFAWPNFDQILTKYWQTIDLLLTRYWPNIDKILTKYLQNIDQTLHCSIVKLFHDQVFSTGPTQWWLTFVGQTVVAISQIFILGIPAQVVSSIITMLLLLVLVLVSMVLVINIVIYHTYDISYYIIHISHIIYHIWNIISSWQPRGSHQIRWAAPLPSVFLETRWTSLLLLLILLQVNFSFSSLTEPLSLLSLSLSRMTTLMMIIIIEIIPAFPQLGIALGFVLPAIIVRDQVMETKNM